MAFDVNSARKAGYSDGEIVNFLAGKNKFNAGQARQAGYSDTEILQHLSVKAVSAPVTSLGKTVEPSTSPGLKIRQQALAKGTTMPELVSKGTAMPGFTDPHAREAAFGMIEAIPTMATGLPAFIVGAPATAANALINLATGREKPLQTAQKEVGELIEPFTYTPKTEAGGHYATALTAAAMGAGAPYLLPLLGISKGMETDIAKEHLTAEQRAGIQIASDVAMLGAPALKGAKTAKGPAPTTGRYELSSVNKKLLERARKSLPPEKLAKFEQDLITQQFKTEQFGPEAKLRPKTGTRPTFEPMARTAATKEMVKEAEFTGERVTSGELQVGDKFSRAGQSFEVIKKDTMGNVIAKGKTEAVRISAGEEILADKGSVKLKPSEVEPIPSITREMPAGLALVEGGGKSYGMEIGTPDVRGTRMLGGLNVEKQNLPYEQGWNLQRAYDTYRAKIEQARDKRPITETQADAKRIAQLVGENDKKFYKMINAKTENLDAWVLAAKDVLNNRTRDFFDTLKTEVDKGEGFNPEAINKSLSDLAEGLAEVGGAGSKVGRALRALREKAQIEGRVSSLLDVFKKDVDSVEVMDKLINKIRKNPKLMEDMIAQFAQKATYPKLRDYVWSIYYESLVSALGTHLVNFTSNGFNLMLDAYPVQVMSTLLDTIGSTVTGKPREFYMAELTANPFRGVGKGIREASKVVMTHDLAELGKAEVGLNLRPQTFPWSHSPSAAARKIAPFMELSTRGLIMGDMFSKSMGFEFQLERLAIKQAKSEGLKVSDKRFRERVRDLTTNRNAPDNWYESAIASAEAYSKSITFNEPAGAISRMFINAKDSFNEWTFGAGNAIMPFIKIAGNLVKQGLTYVPGPGMLSMVENVPNRGPRIKSSPEATKILSKQIIGLVAGWQLFKGVMDGSIYGSPSDEKTRTLMESQGILPDSFIVNGQSISYDRFPEPLNIYIRTVVNAAERWKGRPNDENALEAAIASGIQGLTTVSDNTFLTGVKDLERLFRDLVSTNEQKVRDPWGVYIGRKLAPFVPKGSLVKSVVRSAESEMNVPEETYRRKSYAFTDPFREYAPNASKRAYDRFGRDIPMEGGWLRQQLPWKWSETSRDPVDKIVWKIANYMERTPDGLRIKGYFVGKPDRSIKGVKLERDEYEMYARDAGQTTKRLLDEMYSDGRLKFPATPMEEEAMATLVGFAASAGRAIAGFKMLDKKGIRDPFLRKQLAMDMMGARQKIQPSGFIPMAYGGRQ